MPKLEELSPHEIPRRAQRMFGELASTYVEKGICYVGRVRDVTELRKREPYRDVVIFGRGRTFLLAFEEAERHHRDGTPDEILDVIAGRPPRTLLVRG